MQSLSHFLSYRLQILHGSSYGQSQQITQNKFCNYVITKLRNYYVIMQRNKKNVKRTKCTKK